jgi:hypothetical protein
VRAENIQSVIDQEGFYRVNGLSGEPRYLASYCSFWVFFLMTSWRNILLRNNIKIVILAIYLMVSIFCFSKTGLFTLITGTFILIYNYYAIGNKEYNVLDIKSIILLITTLILSSIILFKIRFTGYDDELYLNTVSLFGIAVEVEPQDLSAIQVWTSSYLHLIFGVGSGLFQYYFDPFSIDAVFRYFKIVDTLDSWRSNISLLNKLVGYGLIGTCLFYYLIFKTFRKYIINNFYTLSLLFIFLFIGLLKISEFYAFIFLPVLLYNLFGNINKAQ